MEKYRGRNLKDIDETACKFFDPDGSIHNIRRHGCDLPLRTSDLPQWAATFCIFGDVASSTSRLQPTH